MDHISIKSEHLKEYLRSLGSVAVAYSSGVDSTFLLKVAADTLGADHVLAVTVSSTSFPKRELNESHSFCDAHQIKQIVIQTNELSIDGFSDNPPNRCYLCKKEIFSSIKKAAAEHGMAYVCEGSNMDDNGDYRPGLQAIAELDVKSPLRHAGLYKSEIRHLSQEMGLPTWDKPSYACLASRFVYGEKITEEKLAMIDQAEQFLIDSGFRQMRVRIHNNIARIEVLPEDMSRVLEQSASIYDRLKSIGFDYITLDLKGYRTGSMNETLPLKKES